MLLFAPNHSHAIASRIAESLGMSLAASEDREFDDGEHKMRPLPAASNVRGDSGRCQAFPC